MAARGRAVIALGISISVDELIVGFTIGYSQYFTTPEAKAPPDSPEYASAILHVGFIVT